MSLDWERALRRLDELNARVEDPKLWDNPKEAEEVMRERRRLDAAIGDGQRNRCRQDRHRRIDRTGRNGGRRGAGRRRGRRSLKALADRADADKVSALLARARPTATTPLSKSMQAQAAPKARTGPKCFSACTPLGRAARLQGRDHRISGGRQAGIKSCTMQVKGENAYGYAKTESGVHRLVRISPYDSSARRHTSVQLGLGLSGDRRQFRDRHQPADLKIDTYRASGAGGQHVNTTDSAVRITHQPSGIVVASQVDRSQHKNREIAMGMLKARLFEEEMRKREEAASAEHAAKTDIGWGHQIRSYVLQPYQMVKDLRTGVTSPTPGDVLDGDLDDFIAAALAQRVTGEAVAVEDVD
jgi:peptide chain release factor 2